MAVALYDLIGERYDATRRAESPIVLPLIQ
jgi:hypothetical protein